MGIKQVIYTKERINELEDSSEENIYNGAKINQ